MGFKRDFAKKELAVVGIVGDLHFGMGMIFFFGGVEGLLRMVLCCFSEIFSNVWNDLLERERKRKVQGNRKGM